MNIQIKTRGMTMVKLIGVAIAALWLVGCGSADATPLAESSDGTGGAAAQEAPDGAAGGVVGVALCVPGASVACVGPAGCSGGQVCAADGKSYGACECVAGSGGASGAGGATTTVTPKAGEQWSCVVTVGSLNSCDCKIVPSPGVGLPTSCSQVQMANPCCWTQPDGCGCEDLGTGAGAANCSEASPYKGASMLQTCPPI